MQTECPHCHTIFRATDETLEHNAQVRCGHCLAVFSPVMLPIDIESESAEHAVDNTPNEETDLKETTPKHVDTTTEEVDISLIREKYEEKQQSVLPDVIPPELRIETHQIVKQRGVFASLVWLIMIAALILTAAGQYAWHNRIELVKHPDYRPWFELVCQQLDCNLPDPRDPSRIELSRKNIFTHPNVPHALMVSGTIVNQAEFEQDYPIMELRFENTRGDIIAARRFAPAEYLDLPQNQIRKMEPGNPMAFTLEVVDPGSDVMSYEFTFL